VKKLALVPLLALAGAACADQPNPLAPEAPAPVRAELQVTSSTYQEAWFLTTPPDPAYVGQTYQVVAEANYLAPQLESNGAVCALSGVTSNGLQTSATVSFIAAGTCTLFAWDPFGIYMIPSEQSFPVVNTTPARVPTPAPPRPAPPRPR
jgi:hypothetical protein